ncbi:hypothetical protein Q5H92_10580 [Hymenobacter sp. M29]|uniref:Uncharacterized protein n=1 Tax=Hymenobacter mellowenesis TaxID=3063995 RepID=A0ABT9AAE2_9BACT|nr:hypothetical protein [Hymenobacter sp. M29]MDO7846803.1 hypothetical protein [Hymenobacter sp. M29]
MNPDFTPTQIRLNEALTELFTSSECWGGRLQMQPTPQDLIYDARGHHQSGQEIAVYPFTLPQQALLQALLRQYAAETPGGIGFLAIAVNLRQSNFTYEHTTAIEEAHAEAAEAAAQAERNRAYRERLRWGLSPAPFGPELAAQVAEALAQGRRLSYGHPAYCGMGLDFVDGHYCYGPVWEGGLEPERTFSDRAGFVAWLAQQSDLSLALLEYEDPTLWNNQTVTRARLRELVGAPLLLQQ